MYFIVATIFSYLAFNVAIWMAVGRGGMMALALANVVGGFATAVWFREEWKKGVVQWGIAASGALGILMIVHGLFRAHSHLPPSLTIEAVYNGFAVSSWPLFVVLSVQWPTQFKERPSAFNLICHFAMFVMVVGRFCFYEGAYDFTLSAFGSVVEAVSGYMLFNVSIKLSAGNRKTNVTMNVVGGMLLALLALSVGGVSSIEMPPLGSTFLAGLSIFGIVWSLGKSYEHFGAIGKASLVAPLVYDGLLIAAPAISLITRETMSLGVNVLLAVGMVAITYIRWRHS